MKKIGLLLLACLLLALPTVAQAPEKAAPDDLAVTAEIVGYSHKPVESLGNKPQLILYVKLDVHNQTKQPREVLIMSCGWDDSWIQKGTYGFCGWGCDKNVPKTFTIPAGQSLVFYAPVCQIRENAGEMKGFMLGFIDSVGCYYCIPSVKKRNQYLVKHTVHWSNELNGNIDPATTPEVKGSDQYPRYSLSEAGK